MNHPFRSPHPPAEAERLREAFARAAYEISPSAVPLAAIEREGSARRRRRRTAVLGAACGALLVPLAVVVLRDGASAGPSDHVKPPVASAATTSPSPSVPAGKVRVVTPGERVQAAPGFTIWLTEDGKHWLEPGAPGTQFRSVTDGNLDLTRPGVSLQQSGDDDRYFLSGIFHGKGEPARVEVRTVAGDFNGTALTLAGRPGWGVWYLVAKLPESATSANTMTGVTESITVYDAKGGVIADEDFSR
ncbi:MULTISPECIES: hypothetical protein [Streptomyces]|uniref:Tat pathway signal sequence domain protein n=1 Tax=Streptomyces dengpaensis TaxID=2049881 RepID=A0ABM6SS79_9ACTN|nr:MULTISPECIES: hypothetical protein [Streptomyces]AVH57563.1 hypothetical protein C4B68_19350 [Streptomyces dengpaensis]PIB02689.1 hypothetical protein B1C81_37950 [Streptomyces sp. HG99]